MRIYCVWTRIVASTPPRACATPKLAQTLSLPLLSRCFASLKNDRLFSPSPFSRGDVVALPSKCRNYYRFSSSSRTFSPPGLLVDIPRESWPNSPPPSFPQKRRYVEYEVATKLARLSIPSLSLFSSDFDRARKIRYFLGRREGGRGTERRESRDRPGLNRKIPGIRLFGRDFSVDTGRALDSVASTDYARNCIQILFLIPSTRPPFLSITFNRAPTIAL